MNPRRIGSLNIFGSSDSFSFFTWISPFGLLTATVQLFLPFIMTPSMTACPPIFFMIVMRLDFHLSIHIVKRYFPTLVEKTEGRVSVFKEKPSVGIRRQTAFPCYGTYFFAYFFLNFSTRPSASTSFCLPVKNGWHFEQISTWIFCLVDRVVKTSPQAHSIFISL